MGLTQRGRKRLHLFPIFRSLDRLFILMLSLGDLNDEFSVTGDGVPHVPFCAKLHFLSSSSFSSSSSRAAPGCQVLPPAELAGAEESHRELGRASGPRGAVGVEPAHRNHLAADQVDPVSVQSRAEWDRYLLGKLNAEGSASGVLGQY